MGHKRQSGLFLLILMVGMWICTPAVLAITKAEALKNFTEDCRTSEAVFAPTTAGENGIASVQASHYGADILINYFKQDLGNETEFENWILDQQLTDGGFRNVEGGEISVFASFHAVRALVLVDKQGRIQNKLITFLDSCIKDANGWANKPTGEKSLVTTYLALDCYNSYLGNLTYVRDTLGMTESIIAYTLSCYDGATGGFKAAVGATVSLEATFSALEILETLNATERFENGAKTLAFVDSLKSSDENYPERYGGFHEMGESESTLVATYHASLVKHILDNSTDPNSLTRSWITSRQNRADGGFIEPASVETDLESSLISSFYAVRALVVYNPDLSLLKGTDWTVEFDWVPLIILIIVVAAIIVVIVWVWKRRSL